MQALTKESFDAFIQENDLVVVDFWSEQCQPCKAFAKICAEVSKDFPEVLFAGVDIETQVDLAREFEVMAVPFVLIIREQVVVFAESGLLNKQTLVDLLCQAKKIIV
jgi:thioredoxin 1